jgi:dihydroorotate dehydrogenase (NAD+) catalytic subunit
MPDLSVTLAGLVLKNPVMPASGTLETLDMPYVPERIGELGALVNKTVTLEAREGNTFPRVWETPSGMLNSIGIPSEGLEEFLNNKLARLRAQNDRLIISIAGFSIREFVKLAKAVAGTGMADFLELNLSCPNLARHMTWSTDKKLLTEVIRSVKKVISIPLIAKLSPNVTEIGEMALCAEEAGADVLSLVNTYQGMAIDVRVKKPALGNITGGLSGPAIKPLALYAVWSAYKKVTIPIIGMGGIVSWQDAVEFLLAGAAAIGVGMYNFVDPEIMWKIIDGIHQYCAENNIARVREIIGCAHKNGCA